MANELPNPLTATPEEISRFYGIKRGSHLYYDGDFYREEDGAYVALDNQQGRNYPRRTQVLYRLGTVHDISSAEHYVPTEWGGYAPLVAGVHQSLPDTMLENRRYRRGRKESLLGRYEKHQKVEAQRRKEQRALELREQREALALEKGRVKARGLLA